MADIASWDEVFEAVDKAKSSSDAEPDSWDDVFSTVKEVESGFDPEYLEELKTAEAVAQLGVTSAPLGTAEWATAAKIAPEHRRAVLERSAELFKERGPMKDAGVAKRTAVAIAQGGVDLAMPVAGFFAPEELQLTPDQEAFRQALIATREGNDPSLSDGWVASTVQQAARMAPPMLMMGAAGRAAGAVGETAGLGARGVSLAQGAGVTAAAYPMAQDQSYRSLIAEGINPEIAAPMSRISGVLEGVIETIIPDPFKSESGVLKGQVRQIVKQAIGRFGVQAGRIGLESFEEGSQAFAGEAVAEIARAIDEKIPNKGLGEAFSAAAEESLGSIGPLSAVMGPSMIRSAVGTARNTAARPGAYQAALERRDYAQYRRELARSAGQTGSTETEVSADNAFDVPPAAPGQQAEDGAVAVPSEQSQQLESLQEMRSKGFISEEDAKKAGIEGKNRKERLANVDKKIKQLEQEAASGGTSPPADQAGTIPPVPTGPQSKTETGSTEVPAERTPLGRTIQKGSQVYHRNPRTGNVDHFPSLKEHGPESTEVLVKLPSGATWSVPVSDITAVGDELFTPPKPQGVPDASQVPTNEARNDVQGDGREGGQIPGSGQVRLPGQEQGGTQQAGQEPAAPEVQVSDIDSVKTAMASAPIGVGGNARVYGIDDTRVVRVPKHVKDVTGEFTPVEHPLTKRGLRVGQAIAKNEQGVEILQRQSGSEAGLALPSGNQAQDDTQYARAIQDAASLPQEAYDEFADTLKALDEAGYQFDPSKSSNVLIDTKAGKFNLVDVNESKTGKPQASLEYMLIPLIGNTYASKYKGKGLESARKDIVNKATEAARKAGINLELGSSGKYSLELAGGAQQPAGTSEGVSTKPTIGSPTVIPDAPVTPETRKGKAEGEDQSSEASADKSSARKMEPTEEGRPADGKPVMPGDRFLTNTGRETTPYPKYDGSTERKTQNGEKRSQQWLIENAMAEAESRGDDFNLTTFRSQLEDARKGKLPQASKDSATLYVFGEDVPKVPKPLLKDRSQQPPSIVPDGITDESSESSAAEIDRRMGKQPESKWQSETRAKLESVPALKGAKVETDEKAGTAKVTRPDGLTTTIHFNADEELAKAATEKGRKPESIHGRYVRKPGEKTGSIYLHSSANHSNVLNHEVMHWLEDQGVVTPAEVEQYGGREAIAEKYGKWAELKQRKKDSVFQRIHDTLEPLFSAQRRFFEDVSKRGVASDAQKPQPHKPDLPTIVDKTDAEAGWITLSDVERQEVTPPEQPAIPEFKRTTPDKGSTTRQFQAERVEKAKTEIADLERKRRAKQGEHDGIRKNATKKRAAVRGEIESLNRMIGKIEGEIAADFTSDTIAKLEDELESPRSYDHYLAGMKAIHRLKASAAEDAARRGEMGREAARAEVSKEQREADRFDAELQGRAKELAKSQGFDSGDAEQIALAASNGFTVFEDRSLSDVVEVQGKRTREARVSEEIRKMFSPVYAAEQDLNDEQKEALKKQYQDASLDDKNWLAKRNDVDKAVREAIRQREDSERKEKAAEKAKDEQEALAHARERAKKHFMDERISKALKKRKPKTKPVKIRRESNGGPVKVVNGKTIAGDQKGELYPNGLILHKSFEEDSKDFVLTHARSGSGFPFSAKKSDMKELVGMIDLLGIDFNVDVDENGALPSELTTRMKKVNTAWDNSDYSVLSEEDRATVEALSEVATTDIQADLILTADDIGANGIAPGMEKVMTDRGVRVVKEMSKAVPEFAYDPVFTVQDGLLVYRDGYIFKLQPQVFNLHPSELKEGQTVGINIEDMGIKRATPQDVVAEILKGAGIPRVTKSKSGRDVSAGYVGSMPVSIQQGEADNDWYVVGGNSKVRVIAVDALNKIRWRQPGQSGDPKTDLEVSGKDVDSKAAASEPQDDSSGATGKGSGTANKIEPNVVERSSVAAGTPQQSSRADFSFTEGETPQGKRLLNRMKGDSVKRRIGPRSILNYLKDVVRTGSIEGKSQLSKKNPGHYKPREHLVRSRTGTSGVIDTHEAGHALSALLRDVDPKVLKRHEAGLVALTHLHGSMASAKTAEEGMAEYIRRFITDYQSIPEPLRSNLQADIAFISPELLAGLKDTNRLWQQFLARPLQERLDASKNDRQQRKDGRGFRDAVYRSLYNIIGGDVAIHKVRRELERPLFQFSQALGSTFRELASDTQADVDNAYQSVIRVPVETQRAIFGDSRSKDQGVRIIAFGDNMFSEEDTQFLRDGGFRVPDEFKHGEPVYLTHQSFEQIREKLGDDWDAFENYGQLRASLERAEKKGHESAWMHENVSQAEARQAIADMENANPDWTQRFDEVREFFDGLLLVATLSGEYTPLEAVRIRNAWDSYWPLLRQVTPEESSRVGRGGPDPSAGVHRAFGSALPLRNLLEAVEMRTKAAMQAYYTNRMMLAMRHYSDTLHAMDDAPFDIRKAGARLMVPLKMDLKKVASLSPEEQAQMITKYMNEQLEKEARDRGEEVDPDELLSVEDVAISMPWRPIFRATRPGAIQVIGLTENGQRKYYQVTDPLLFDLFSNSESMSRYGTWLARFFAKGIGPWKRALTQNLAFAVRNVLRDTATALLAGEGAKAFMPGIYLAYGVVGRLNGSLGRDAPAQAELFSRSLEVLHHPRHKKVWDDFKETVTEGLLIPDYWEMNFYDRVSEAPGQLSAGALLPVTIFNWATGGRYISQMSEELQREGAFSEARGRGVSYEYAQRQYDQISGNFSQRQPHHATATFVRSAGFLNPGLQIWWGQVKRWTDPDPRAGKLHRAKLPALAAVYAVSSAINVALVYAMFGDDDDKLEEVLNDMRERPDYEKDTTMSVMGTVRLPFEYGLGGAVSSFAWNATQDSLLGGSNESIPTRLKAFLARAVQVPGPTDAIHPYLKTAMELTMGDVGFSFYRQDSIVPEQLIVQYPVNPELRAYDDTPALFKQIGETARVSPLKVEYAVGSLLTGTASDLIALGGKVAGGETLEAKDFPVLSRLIQRPSTGFRSQAVRELRKSQQEVQAMGVKIQKMGDAASQELLDKYAKLHDASLAYDVVSKMYDEVQEEVDAAETDHTAVDKTERQMTHFARQFLNYQAGKVPAPTQLKEREHEYYGLKAIQATGDPESKTAIATQEKAVAMLKLSGYTYEESAKALIDYWESTNTTKNSRGVEVRGNAKEMKDGRPVLKAAVRTRLVRLRKLYAK